ncbi:MAG: acyl carrier protein [Chloroflexota bacterium]
MTEEKILEFIRSRGKTDKVERDTDLFKGGYVNSLFAVEIVLFLEKTFKIRLKDKDITQDNFRTVAAIANLVDRVRGV